MSVVPLTLEQLLAWLRERVAATADLRLDSRRIRAGDVFVACPGTQGDGRDYVAQAIERGAAAVLFEADDANLPTLSLSVPSLAVSSLRAQLGALADTWYGQPSAAVGVLAVTGTNGKTSCVQWLAQILNESGSSCGTIGTLGVVLPDGSVPDVGLTTPDVLSMHAALAAMRRAGAHYVAIEASSIGIEQGRLDGVRVGLAAFTNLSHDHLDYHGTMARYEAAKAALFLRPEVQTAIINIDDAAGRRIADLIDADRRWTYGFDDQAQVRAQDLHTVSDGQIFTLLTLSGRAQVLTPLTGSHNVQNLLLLAAVLDRLGWSLAHIAAALASLRPVPGRLEVVPLASNDAPRVIVDYAHTPDALQRVLLALGPSVKASGGRLICVFGCGGQRDHAKRPEMGRIAAEEADHVIITNDNPRHEDPQTIIAEILSGVPQAAAHVSVEPRRSHAIAQALWMAQPEDLVLLAGKGHEAYQELADGRHVFDDRQWARVIWMLTRVTGVKIDTRKLVAGDLFVALPGERVDGHDYLAQAQAAGAVAAVVAHPVADVALPQLVLGDTRRALGILAAIWRARHNLPVVAVTGSNGKTTTKEMISAILAQWLGEAQRLASEGNLNNEIGVPLTLLRLRPSHRAAVVELGMNHPGEIAMLADWTRPSVALVNNAQREHQEFMGSVRAVAEENGQVLRYLPTDGVAVFPGDDAHADVWQDLAQNHRVIRFGLADGMDITARDIASDLLGTRFTLVTPFGAASLTLPVPGLHNVRNALAASACALAAGAPLHAVVEALGNFAAVKGRMQRHVLPDGRVLIDDTYNANPDSVRAAIDVLAQLPAPQILVLGDMGEVGNDGPAMHREVGQYAKEKGIGRLLTLGEASAGSAQAFGEHAHACDDVEDILRIISDAQGRSILVKGSRFMRMERVVQALMASDASQEDHHAA